MALRAAFIASGDMFPSVRDERLDLRSSRAIALLSSPILDSMIVRALAASARLPESRAILCLTSSIERFPAAL